MWSACLAFLLLRCVYCVPGNLSSINPCTDRHNFFLAPGVLTAGGSNRVCVSRFYPEGAVHVVITLRTENDAATASRDLPPGDGGCLDIAVPQKPNTKADLFVNIRYPEAQCTWERHMVVRIAPGKLVMVHTERARYRPGDTLRVRVFALKTNLAPALGAIEEIWLEGPRGAWDGTRAAQWNQVSTRMGIAQVQHDIDEMAPTGRWTVRAKLSDGSQGSAAFMVSNYELPPFQMSVRHPAKVLKSSDRLVWTVCVRYPWTEAVEGMLVIRIRGAGGSAAHISGIRTAVRLRAPRACHRHAAGAKRIGLNDSNPPLVVIADFSFQEEGTGTWQNTTVVSEVVDKAVTLKFLTKHRAIISPGLPYKLKVKATRWDEMPASGERVRVCRTPVTVTPVDLVTSSNLTQTCNDAVTDEKGIARVMFLSTDDGSPSYKFEATLHNDSTVVATPVKLPSHHGGSVYAALGPLRHEKQGNRTFVPLYLTVKNATKPVTVHFVVITRGGVIYRWGATTQCALANSGDHFQVASRNDNCFNRPNPNSIHDVTPHNTSDSLLDRQMFRVMLPVKVTHQMCPDSYLVAYFYHGDEVVSATKHFEMDDCFASKVETNWLTRQVAPGSKARFQIRADSKALCALSVLDIAAKIPQAPTAADALLAALKRLLNYQRNLTEYDAAGQCFYSSDSIGYPSTGLEFTDRWLAAAGVRLVGGDSKLMQCDPRPAMMLNDGASVPRSDFSEAWLWRLVDVSANGTAVTNARAPDSISKFEANTICVTKTGLAVAAPATLQVFSEFFIHADGPRRLRRGDSTIIRYRIFNYLYEPLSVQIQILTDPHLEAPASYAETACVPARAAAARHVAVRARLPGAARLSLRARAVHDANCGNATSGRTGLSDEVIIQITVDPEGVPVRDHQSALLCAEGSVESKQSEISWSWPRVDAVPGTETLTVWAVGDLAGPLLTDADSMVLLPRGCGEQNMARLATNLLALTQLSPVTPAAATAKEHVARGLTRQLQYVHPRGGFSAFGALDPTPSTWLTAFSLKYLWKAHQMLSPGLPVPPAITRAKHWLLKQQMENGCFRNEGHVFHRELKGGLNEDGEIAQVALTAYVIAALTKSSLSHRVVRNTLSCLRALPPMKVKTPARVYAQALLGYTYMRLRRYEDELRKTNEASLIQSRKAAGLEDDEEMKELAALLKIAKRSGDYVWWETSSLSTSIEATGYALLALSSCPEHLRETKCASDARGAVRWLATKANPAGGFVSTQDTLVALEALTSWLSKQPLPLSNLTVTARSKHTVRTVRLKPGVKVPEITKMDVGDQLHVTVKGSGCALVQATRSYNTISPDESSDKQLSVQVTVRTDGPFACDTSNTTCFCAAVIETCVVWLGTFPEMALLEVALPGGYAADAALLYSQLYQTNAMLRRIELSSRNGKATLYLGTRDGSDSLGHGGHRCYNIHAMGPQTRTKPAYARIINYYAPSVNDTQMYTIPEECPPRITSDSNEYHSSDNLYAKAKSLNDSSELVITYEYSYDDIPEGIPLDDPMYDNLTQGQKQVNEIKKPSADDMYKINTITENPIRYQTQSIPSREHDPNSIGLQNASDSQNVIITTKSPIKNEIQSTTTRIYDRSSTAFEKESKSHNKNNVTSENPMTYEIKFTNNTIKMIEYDPDSIKPNSESNNKLLVNKDLNQISNINGIDTKINAVTDDKTPLKISEESLFRKDNKVKTENKHRIEERDDEKERKDMISESEKDNPNFSSFHVLDSEKDLDVPTGIEGPVPSVVLPPDDFLPVIPVSMQSGTPPPRLPPLEMHRGFDYYPMQDTRPYYYHQLHDPYRTYRRYNSPYG